MAQVVIDGRPVTLLDTEAGTGPPLLCLHGWTGSKEDWEPVIDGLAKHRRVLAPDLPGHRGSPGPPDEAGYSLTAMTGWVLRLLDALDVDSVHLAGHSLGGLLAQRVAAAASQRLASLILTGTGLGALREDAADYAVQIAAIGRDEGMEAAWLESLRLNREVRELPVDTDPRSDFLHARFLELSPAALVAGARALLSSAPLGAFLRGIDIPVLVVSGADDDTWTLAEQTLLATTIAGARHVVIPDCGHTAMRETPDAFLEAVATFLDP